MKNIPYAPIICVAALLGLPLALTPRLGAAEEKIPASVLKKYDANHDGTLDPAERAAEEAGKEKQQAAREARRTEELARYDANKDGKINPEERAAEKADAAKARA